VRVEAEHGYYLIAWGELPSPDVTARDPATPGLVVTAGALVVGTFHASASVSLFSSEPHEVEPEVLDTEVWDQVLEGQFTASTPLRVLTCDGAPAHEDDYALTDEPGTWGIRLYVRRESFLADEVPGRASEDHFVDLWQVG
jgi:hypothetical protein